jgi:hypothetical protein
MAGRLLRVSALVYRPNPKEETEVFDRLERGLYGK